MNINDSRESIHVRNSDLSESRLSNTRLSGATFDNVNLLRAVFVNVNLADATFTDVNLSNVSISDANITDMTINGVLVSELLQAHRAAAALTSVMPVLRVQDMQRAIDWYTQIAGFALQWRSPNDGGGENCMLGLGGAVLMLSTGTHLGDRPAFTGTLYFNTRSVAVIYDRIKEKADLVWPLQRMDYGTTEFGVRDPDGYVLAFAQR